MSLPHILRDALRLPVIGAPMFIVSNPDLVIEQCKAGVVGSFPALNARPEQVLGQWLQRITAELDAHRAAHPGARVAPFAVNQIVHPSNPRLQHDVELCARYKVPIQITSLHAPEKVVEAAHGYGGLVFHDVISIKHARRALQAGVDGLILVCHGAGGHAGRLSPFALVPEVRSFYDGTIILSGAIASGAAILAAQAIGADLAYIGTRFIATHEAQAVPDYKQMLVDSTAEDIVYTNLFSGVHGNYLRDSVRRTGFDPDNLPAGDKSMMNFGSGGNQKAKAWVDIWSAGQGTGQIREILQAAAVVARLEQEYRGAVQRTGLAAAPPAARAA
jgi:nitronate monooxygenase